MRVLKYAILGLLDKGQLSGYDITSKFKEEIGHFWSAKHSQIYPELKKLAEEGFVKYQIVIQGTKLEKKVYSITELGKTELHEWMNQYSPIPETQKDEFMLKAYFVSSMSPEEAKQLFEDQMEKRKQTVAFLEERFQEFEGKEEPVSFSSPDFGHYLVLSRALEREKSYISWLERMIKRIGG
ncbi:PadR family transcriptional regulator [Fictibacillus enclensis]|uniref:PadR family transcriptional regulator n=1 Tax=Fictibacillus enclensis TaxID=1017270 RepID=UPI0024C09D53|nr:PadR family transcriptional regulator [Fictibacillus enclensis]MDM5340746.1 PadR family transcriptional regulator [Fictibacillus enclensis]WHY72174.1 PadR family transcriptional regulator [Fictibacillus enclensis]